MVGTGDLEIFCSNSTHGQWTWPQENGRLPVCRVWNASPTMMRLAWCLFLFTSMTLHPKILEEKQASRQLEINACVQLPAYAGAIGVFHVDMPSCQPAPISLHISPKGIPKDILLVGFSSVCSEISGFGEWISNPSMFDMVLWLNPPCFHNAMLDGSIPICSCSSGEQTCLMVKSPNFCWFIPHVWSTLAKNPYRWCFNFPPVCCSKAYFLCVCVCFFLSNPLFLWNSYPCNWWL